MTRVLIVGAGIGGPALAYWLRRKGFTPTVVERASALRAGGQAVDVRGVALDVVDRMGLLDAVRERKTIMRGMSVVDRDGTELMRSTEFAASSGRLDSDDVEILREDLVGLLHEHTRDDVEYVFGGSIVDLRDDGARVDVGFSDGTRRSFDRVIGADGLHSSVRRLAFGPEERYLRHLGAYVGVFTAPNFLDLEYWQVWMRDGAAGYGIYSARDNTEMRVNLGVESGPIAFDPRDVDAQRRLLAERLAKTGWETPRLLEAMWKASDFYFDAMAQVHMDAWTAGRVTLLGDAAHCASPLSGQGTSLALAGAYVLAEELADGDGAAGYERRMRPFVEANQALATVDPGAGPSEEAVSNAKDALTL